MFSNYVNSGEQPSITFAAWNRIGLGLEPIQAAPQHQEAPPQHQEAPPQHQEVPLQHQEVPLQHQEVPPQLYVAVQRVPNSLLHVSGRRPSVYDQWAIHRATLDWARRTFAAHLEGYKIYAQCIHDIELRRTLDHTKNMSLESPQGRQQQWQIHRDFLAYIGEVSPELKLEYATRIHNIEARCLLAHTETMSLESLQGRQLQWQIHRELLAYIGRVSPQLKLEYTTSTHNTETRRILDYTRDMSLASPQDRQLQWQIHRELLAHIANVFPERYDDYAKSIHGTEVTLILDYTRDMPFVLPQDRQLQWQIHRELMTHIRTISPRSWEKNKDYIYRHEINDLLNFTKDKPLCEQWQIHPELYAHIASVDPELVSLIFQYMHNSEQKRVMFDVRSLPEHVRWGWFQSHLLYVKFLNPDYVSRLYDSILVYEERGIPEHIEGVNRQNRLNTIHTYGRQLLQNIGHVYVPLNTTSIPFINLSYVTQNTFQDTFRIFNPSEEI